MAPEGSNSAGALLEIIEFRVRMQDAGAINPRPSVREGSRKLVNHLRSIPADEWIDFSLDRGSNLVQYVRRATGEVLVEMFLE